MKNRKVLFSSVLIFLAILVSALVYLNRSSSDEATVPPAPVTETATDSILAPDLNEDEDEEVGLDFGFNLEDQASCEAETTISLAQQLKLNPERLSEEEALGLRTYSTTFCACIMKVFKSREAKLGANGESRAEVIRKYMETPESQSDAMTCAEEAEAKSNG